LTQYKLLAWFWWHEVRNLDENTSVWRRIDADIAEVFVACEDSQLLGLGIRKDDRIFGPANADVVNMLRDMPSRDEIGGQAAR